MKQSKISKGKGDRIGLGLMRRHRETPTHTHRTVRLRAAQTVAKRRGRRRQRLERWRKKIRRRDANRRCCATRKHSKNDRGESSDERSAKS